MDFKIEKRDGRIVPYDVEKVELSIKKAMNSVGISNGDDIVSLIEEKLEKLNKPVVHIEDIQDISEECMMTLGYTSAAKSYILYREKHRRQRQLREHLDLANNELDMGINAAQLLQTRYLARDIYGNVVETPSELFRRVAKHIAKADLNYDKKADIEAVEELFYRAMVNMEFLPNSPTLFSAGRNNNTLAACLSEDTELLTKNGWKNFSEYADEEVLTYNLVDNILEFQLPIKKVSYSVNGDMVQISNKQLDVLVTKDHDIIKDYYDGHYKKWTNRKVKAETLVKDYDDQSRIPVASYYNNVGIDLSLDECELLGWIITDGYLDKNSNGIIIAQTLMCDELEDCLNSCEVDWNKSADKYRIQAKYGKIYREYLTDIKIVKYDILYSMTQLQLNALWKGIWYGDAQKRTPSYMIVQEDDKRREQFQIIALMTGRRAWETDNNRGQMLLNVADRPFAFINKKEMISFVKYDGMVWCVQVPNENIVIRRNGKIAIVGNCFVLDIEDSLEDIFEKVKQTGIITKMGGGVGLSFSNLRPKNSPVGSTGGISSGPISFMKVFDTAIDVCKQGGVRRGALMGVLRVDHPDILEFIQCKQDKVSFQNFNISVLITDKFMTAYYDDDVYDLVDPRTNEVVQQLSAKMVMDYIVMCAHNSGDPGMVFIDRINKKHPLRNLEIKGVNVCGEQPLAPNESCLLGAINLSKYVKNGKIDYQGLRKIVTLVVHFLDNLIDVNNYPLKQIDAATKATRKIGVGVMGWAEMLVQLGVSYESEEALELAESVMGFIDNEAHKASRDLGMIRGNFPLFSDYKRNYRTMRNAVLTTAAPTGSRSLIAETSSGIEPLFSVAHTRVTGDGMILSDFNKYFIDIMKERGLWSDDIKHLVGKAGHIGDLEEIPDDIKSLFKTSHEVSPEQHVLMQAAFQKHIGSSVSKTVNLNNSATLEDVRAVYLKAYETGCKGITVFRDGCRGQQVLTSGCETCDI